VDDARSLWAPAIVVDEWLDVDVRERGAGAANAA
jgi:hypothetical protein